MFASRFRGISTATLSFSIAGALHAGVVLIGDAFQRSPQLAKSLQAEKVVVASAEASALGQLDAAQTTVVVLAPKKPLPPEARVGLARFITSGGHAVVVGAHAFDYAPRPTRPVPLSRFDNPQGHRVVRPERPAARTAPLRESARVESITGPDGKAALNFRTHIRGMEDFLVELDVAAVRSPRRSVLQFWAKGDSYMDLLALPRPVQRMHLEFTPR